MLVCSLIMICVKVMRCGENRCFYRRSLSPRALPRFVRGARIDLAISRENADRLYDCDPPPPAQSRGRLLLTAIAIMASSDWLRFAEGELKGGIRSARALADSALNESAPYDHLYRSEELLKSLEQRCGGRRGSGEAAASADGGAAASVDASTAPTSSTPFFERCARRLRLERGLLLVQTDLLARGDALLSAALEEDEPCAGLPAAAAVRGRNALGALWCDRGDADAALLHLGKAEAQYKERTAGDGAAAAGAGGGGASPADTVTGEVAGLSLGGGGGSGSGGGEASASAASVAAERALSDAWAEWDPVGEAEALEDAHTQTRKFSAGGKRWNLIMYVCDRSPQ